MGTVLISVLAGLIVAVVSGVLVDRIRRRADRDERANPRLEVVQASFVRDDDESLTLDITVRNLGTTSCPIQEARFSGIEVWRFPRPMSPMFRPISHTYDVDLGSDSASVVLHQVVPPGDVDRFAFRLGTSKPIPPGIGSFLYLFSLELALHKPTATQDLGRFLVDIRQPMRFLGMHGVEESLEWRQKLAERARELASLIDSDTQVDPRARIVLDNLCRPLELPAD